MSEYTKGKKNKLKVGDKVEFTPHCVDGYATHLVDNYSQKHDCYYGREIVSGLRDVASWLHAYFTKKMPKGKIVGYGAEDDKNGFNSVRVEAKLKYSTISHYFSEVTDVRKIVDVKKAKKVKK